MPRSPRAPHHHGALNESPSEKEGKSVIFHRRNFLRVHPSMKVPPKRKGNIRGAVERVRALMALNESPSEKEGKFRSRRLHHHRTRPLNESPSEKEGKFRSRRLHHHRTRPLNESPSEKEGKY